jgi:hypothetical protein
MHPKETYPLNIVDAETCEFWLQLVDRGDEDLEFQLLSPVGVIPMYIHGSTGTFEPGDFSVDVKQTHQALIRDNTVLSALHDGSLQLLLEIPWKTEELPEGWSVRRSVMEFAKANHLALGQPFQVRANAHPYSCETDCGTEYDVNYTCTILGREPIEPVIAQERWTAWEAKDRGRVTEMRAAMRELVRLRQTDVSALYVSSFSYGNQGVAYRLCSNHTRVSGSPKGTYADLLEARSDVGDHELCKAQLREKAMALFPGLILADLPHHRAV